MKYRWKWYSLLAAALIVGLLLPYRMVKHDAFHQSAGEESMPIRERPLMRNRTWNFAQRLRNAAIAMTPLETKHVGTMDAEDAENAGRRILNQLESAGVLQQQISWERKQCKYYLMVGREENVVTGLDQMGAFYAWLCSFSDSSTGAEIGLLIDDDTGLLLAAGFIQEDVETSPWKDQGNRMNAAMHFAIFCEKSYGLSLRTIEMTEDDENQLTDYLLTFENGAGEQWPLRFSAGETAFKFQAMIGFR